jgi:hypothetical protein
LCESVLGAAAHTDNYKYRSIATSGLVLHVRNTNRCARVYMYKDYQHIHTYTSLLYRLRSNVVHERQVSASKITLGQNVDTPRKATCSCIYLYLEVFVHSFDPH